MDPVLTRVGDLEAKDTEKAGAFSAFLESAFTDKSDLQDSEVCERMQAGCRNNHKPQVQHKEKIDFCYLANWGISKMAL